MIIFLNISQYSSNHSGAVGSKFYLVLPKNFLSRETKTIFGLPSGGGGEFLKLKASGWFKMYFLPSLITLREPKLLLFYKSKQTKDLLLQ